MTVTAAQHLAVVAGCGRADLRVRADQDLLDRVDAELVGEPAMSSRSRTNGRRTGPGAGDRPPRVGVDDDAGEQAGLPARGGSGKSSTGNASSPSTAAAKKPMPRCANSFQIVSRFAPPLAARSACRIELRMSRNDGFAGASSIARVTIISTVRRAERVAEIPERLAPDLAVGVHLGPADDLAVVAVGVAARARGAVRVAVAARRRSSRPCSRSARCGSGRRRPRRNRPRARRRHPACP